METFFRNLEVGVETPYKHGFDIFYLKEDGHLLVQDPINKYWVIYATSIARAIEKENIY